MDLMKGPKKKCCASACGAPLTGVLFSPTMTLMLRLGMLVICILPCVWSSNEEGAPSDHHSRALYRKRDMITFLGQEM